MFEIFGDGRVKPDSDGNNLNTKGQLHHRRTCVTMHFFPFKLVCVNKNVACHNGIYTLNNATLNKQVDHTTVSRFFFIFFIYKFIWKDSMLLMLFQKQLHIQYRPMLIHVQNMIWAFQKCKRTNSGG